MKIKKIIRQAFRDFNIAFKKENYREGNMSGKEKIECDAKAICAKYSQSSPSNTKGGNGQERTNKGNNESPNGSNEKKPGESKGISNSESSDTSGSEKVQPNKPADNSNPKSPNESKSNGAKPDKNDDQKL